MAAKAVLCLKVSSKCYWIIGLLICINFWLISKLKLQQSTQNEHQKQVTMGNDLGPSQKLLIKSEVAAIEERSADEAPNANKDDIENIFSSEIIDVQLGTFDDSRKYKMFDNVIVGSKFVSSSIEFDVTLATQSSLDKLHWISHIIR